MKRDICLDRLIKQSINHSDSYAYFSKIGDMYQGVTWQDYHAKVKSFALALNAISFLKGSKVAILGSNRLEWLIACLGTQYVQGISVGIYTSNSAQEVAYVVNHSDAELLVVENKERFLRQVKPELSSLDNIKHVILMTEEKVDDDRVMTFKAFLALAKDTLEVNEKFKAIKADDIATMIYTSGTTGNPKSVMLSHNALMWTVAQVVEAWNCNRKDRAFSYLPLAHIAEQMITIYAPLYCGMQCYLLSNPEQFKDSLSEVQPTVFFGVPRVYEKIYEAIKLGLKRESTLKKLIFSYFSHISYQYYLQDHKGEEPSFLLRVQFLAAKKLFAKLKKKIGLNKARLCACGAAPISKDILNFLMGVDIPIYEVFGQSENCGPTTFNLPKKTKIGTVGRAMTGAIIKIADDGEILIKGPHVFSGYYKDQQATNDVLKNGWLYSGDIGSIDEEGFITITDRKKDILITAGGKNISPQNLESMLKHLPYVQSAVVVGDSKKYLCALFSPDMDAVSKKALSMGFTLEHAKKIINDSAIHEEIKIELAKINDRLAPVEQIKKYAMLEHEFSIDGGEFTPTLKVKRKYVNQKYKNEIDKMYQ